MAPLDQKKKKKFESWEKKFVSRRFVAGESVCRICQAGKTLWMI